MIESAGVDSVTIDHADGVTTDAPPRVRCSGAVATEHDRVVQHRRSADEQRYSGETAAEQTGESDHSGTEHRCH